MDALTRLLTSPPRPAGGIPLPLGRWTLHGLCGDTEGGALVTYKGPRGWFITRRVPSMEEAKRLPRYARTGTLPGKEA